MFDLKPLKYDTSKFASFISEKTFSFHHGKHLAGYVNNLNNLIKGTPHEGKSLEHIIKNSSGAVFNNAAQIFNHEFYFDCLTPEKMEINKDFEACLLKDLPNFKADFIKAATGIFGSGWAWLVYKNNKFEILCTPNANTPLEQSNCHPLFVADVWEHAYYLDHQNLRARYLEEMFDYINWDFVKENYEKISK